MEVVHLSLTELRALISRPRCGNLQAVERLKCICTIDIFCEVERMKKHQQVSPALDLIRTKESELYEAIEIGYVLAVDLDHRALEDGMFVISDDYCSVALRERAADPGIHPAASVRSICLSPLDETWGSHLVSDAACTYDV